MNQNSERDKFILDNMNLVHYFAKRICPSKNDYEDIVQEGIFGLILAADRFDESKGFTFATFASQYICGYMKRYIREKMQLIHFPRSILDLRYKIAKYLEQNPAASNNDICKAFGISSSEYNECMITCVSLDALIDEEENKSDSFIDTIPDNSFSEKLRDKQDENIFIEIEDRVVKKLSKRNRDIYDDFFYSTLFGDKISQRELAIKYNTSQPQVSRVINRINKKILDEYKKNS